MPPFVVDWIQTYNEFIKIVVTAIISGASGYGIHWLQTKRDREWQKKRDQKLSEIQKLEEQQNALRRLVKTLIENSRGLVFSWGLDFSQEVEFRSKLYDSIASFTSTQLLEDEKLQSLTKRLFRTIDELIKAIPEELGHFSEAEDKVFEGMIETILSADELPDRREMDMRYINELKRIYGDALKNFFSKYLGRLEVFGYLIDQRFEELKAQILEEV